MERRMQRMSHQLKRREAGSPSSSSPPPPGGGWSQVWDSGRAGGVLDSLSPLPSGGKRLPPPLEDLSPMFVNPTLPQPGHSRWVAGWSHVESMYISSKCGGWWITTRREGCGLEWSHCRPPNQRQEIIEWCLLQSSQQEIANKINRERVGRRDQFEGD